MARKAKRRGLDPKTLPHAEKARIASEFVEFFTDKLPDYISREFELLDIAWAENDLFEMLSSMPAREFKKRGMTRADIPTLMLSTFHLLHVAKKRKRKAAKKKS